MSGRIISFKAKGSIYQLFVYVVRPFCPQADKTIKVIKSIFVLLLELVLSIENAENPVANNHSLYSYCSVYLFKWDCLRTVGAAVNVHGK